MDRYKKRIQKELAELERNKVDGINLIPNEDDLKIWRGEIHGPIGTPYEGFILKTKIKLTNDYPFASPSVSFEHPVYHPNVESSGGRICLDILGDKWCPAYSLTQLMLSLSSLLDDPNALSPLNGEAARNWRDDRPKYNENARKICEKHCSKI